MFPVTQHELINTLKKSKKKLLLATRNVPLGDKHGYRTYLHTQMALAHITCLIQDITKHGLVERI